MEAKIMYGCRFYACLSTVVVLVAGPAAVADDAYYGIPIDRLSIAMRTSCPATQEGSLGGSVRRPCVPT
jgi:hypothetical protein